MKAFNSLLFPILLFLGIPVFFILANWYIFDLDSFTQGFVFSKKIIEGLANGGKFSDLKFQVYLAFALSVLPLLGYLYINKPKTTKKTHGKARWADKNDIEKFKIFSKEGFLKNTHPLGVNFGKGFVLGLFGISKKAVCYDKPLGCLIVAPPGAGKSASVAIPNLLTLKTSCIITDIKKELYKVTAGYRQKALNNKILIFDPFGDDNTCFFNPFDYKIVSKMNFNQKLRLVNEVANTIFSGDTQNKNGDDHWISRAKDLFVFYALYDLSTQNYSTFFDIAMGTSKNYIPKIHPSSRFYPMLYKKDNYGNLLRDNHGNLILEEGVNAQQLFYLQASEQKYTDINDPRNYIEESQEQIEENVRNGAVLLDEIVKNDARSWADMAVEEFNSIKSTFNRIVSVFKSYQVKAVTDHMSFEYEDFRNENISLYIAIAQTDIDTLAPLVRILLESIAKNLLLRESKKESERIYFILDEFVRFGKLPFLLEMPALCRSYGVVPLFITQSYSLIKKYYSEDDLKILKEVVAYQILFKMNGADDAEMVAKEVGKYTRLNRSSSTKDGSLFFGGTSSYSLEGAELITAQDILNIPDDEVIVIVTGNKAKPLLLKANYYFKNKALTKRVEWKIDFQREFSSQEEKPTTQQKAIELVSEQKAQEEELMQKALNEELKEQQSQEAVEEVIEIEKNIPTPQSKDEEASRLLAQLAGYDESEEEDLYTSVVQRNDYVLIISQGLTEVSLKKPHSKKCLDKKIYDQIQEDICNLSGDNKVKLIDEQDRKAMEERGA